MLRERDPLIDLHLMGGLAPGEVLAGHRIEADVIHSEHLAATQIAKALGQVLDVNHSVRILFDVAMASYADEPSAQRGHTKTSRQYSFSALLTSPKILRAALLAT